MTDYTELVKALRCCATMTCKGDECKYMILGCHDCFPKLHDDAAAAIEALIGTVGDLQAIRERLEEENDALRLEPKRGEWVEENRRPRSSQFVCSECHRTAYDPQPTRDKAWKKRCRYAYCPNCGAKMEVQDGKRCD